MDSTRKTNNPFWFAFIFLPIIALAQGCSDGRVGSDDDPAIEEPGDEPGNTGGGNGDGGVEQILPPTEILPPVDFGAVFSTVFNANPNDPPVDPIPTDLPPVSKQAAPIE